MTRRAEARDQRAREEARPVHRDDVPLNAEIGIAETESPHIFIASGAEVITRFIMG